MRHPLFSRNCHEIRSLNGIVQWRSPYSLVFFSEQQQQSNKLEAQFIKTNNTLAISRQATVSLSSWHLVTLVRHSETLWSATRINKLKPLNTDSFQSAQPAPKVQAGKCWLVKAQQFDYFVAPKARLMILEVLNLIYLIHKAPLKEEG